MTLVYTRRHMHQLISEIKNEWVVDNPNDPDLRSIADVLPLDVLEAAYIAKLGAVDKTPLGRADTTQKKLAVMRRLFAAWLREPQLRIGQFIVVALRHGNPGYSAEEVERRLFYQEDGALADLVETRYYPKQ